MLEFKTTEEIAVGVLGFLANFGRETRLMVCERPKFAKSAKGAPKSELNRGVEWNCLAT